MINSITPPQPFKNKINKTYYSKVFKELNTSPKTMLMVAKKTGIERAYICWIIKQMRENKKVEVFCHDLCKVSKHKAGYYTTNPDLFKKNFQTVLF